MDQTRYTPAQSTLGRDDLVDRTRALLQAHVPLSLLLDLSDPAGPDSVLHFTQEQADLSWLRPADA